MENIFKIKIRSNPDPREQYPSERKYSATTVLGLSVIYLCLSILALILAILTFTGSDHLNADFLQNEDVKNEIIFVKDKQEWTPSSSNYTEETSSNQTTTQEHDHICFYLSLSATLVTLAGLITSITGFLAWKRWYIDANIKCFFIMTCFASIMSIISLIFLALAFNILYDHYPKEPRALLKLGIHITIATLIALIWSILSAQIAYQGMKNTYPDDVFTSQRRGRVQSNTKHSGSKLPVMPPDILNHFPEGKKFTKYFPKKDPGNLPKAESNVEYQERVRKFLTAEVEA